MKRSEMIDMVAADLEDLTQLPSSVCKSTAVVILKRIEDFGMLPPLAMVHDSPYPKGHKWYGPNKTLENQWEPEDV